jgi:hypothetical protein
MSLPEHEFGIGPSFSYILKAKNSGYSFNFDTSYTHAFHWAVIITPSINFKLIKLDKEIYYGPQFELCYWYYVNVGGGVGYLFGEKNKPVYHIFVGLPLIPPIRIEKFMAPFKILYFEPYYRLNVFSKNELFHEIGIIIKINTFDGP